MKYLKFFEFFYDERKADKGDIEDIFNEFSDYYDCNVEISEQWTDFGFCIFLFDKRPDINKSEAISKIIEFEQGKLISPKFIDSYLNDTFYKDSSEESKSYHRDFRESPEYQNDVEMIKKYYKKTRAFLVLIEFNHKVEELCGYDFDPVLKRLKSMYDLNVLYFKQNKRLSRDKMLTTILLF